jgi:PAS domain-containing protein
VDYPPVELILMRQLASYLATPIFLVDAGGTLVFYNEAAEGLLGRRFEDLPEMGRDEWLQAFQPHQLDGSHSRPTTIRCRPPWPMAASTIAPLRSSGSMATSARSR